MKFREILNYCNVLNSETKIYRKCEEVTEIRNYISIDGKCFTLFSQLSHESNEVFEVDIERNVLFKYYNLIKMEFKPEFKNIVNVFFHSRFEKLNAFNLLTREWSEPTGRIGK